MLFWVRLRLPRAVNDWVDVLGNRRSPIPGMHAERRREQGLRLACSALPVRVTPRPREAQSLERPAPARNAGPSHHRALRPRR